MSHPNLTHEQDNEYLEDEVSLDFRDPKTIRATEKPVVRSEEWWWSVITGIDMASVRPKKSGRLFGPRDEQHPV